MKQLFLKKLITVCAVASLTATSNLNATETVHPTEQKISSEKKAVNDIPFFKGHRQGRGVTLQWVANNVESFEIQHSTDGDWFDPLETMSSQTQSKGGNNNGRFSFNIAEVYPGETFYRIKGTLPDGSVMYSETISVRIVQRK
ncbi:MAG: hypothetical protein H0V30_06305 [Chitinophagaceae bacterium]|nr:hypothetical protein [Chitinophagaceae bacterium]